MIRTQLALGVAALLIGTATAGAQPIGIGTSPQGTLTYRAGATVAKALEESAKMPARVQPSSGTGVIMPLVQSGELDLGLANVLELTQAYDGTGEFAKRPQDHLRLVAVLFPIRVGFFVRKDSPMRTVKDVKGKTIAYGYTAQEVIKDLVRGILADGGMRIQDMKTVLVPNLVRGVDDFMAGKIDVGFFALGQAKVQEADAAVGGIRFLQMIDAPEGIAAMRKEVPGSYLGAVAPAPGEPGVPDKLTTMFYDYTIFANDKLPKDKVYKIVQTLAEQKDEMATGMPLFKDLTLAHMYLDFPVPYHEGALAYYKEKGLSPSK